MEKIEARLKELGYELPGAPGPGGNYLPYRMVGNQLILSGVIAVRDGKLTHAGQVGKEQTVESAQEAAVVCVLNLLAVTKEALGSLDRVERCLMLYGFVNAVSGFEDSTAVINGASDLLVNLLGEAGQHARAAVPAPGLPKNSTVELQLTLEFK